MHDLKQHEVSLSRWGFHPCSHETYLKLKELNKLFWKAQRVAGAWLRWNRKDSGNRYYWDYLPSSGPRPKKVRSNRAIPKPQMCSVWGFVSRWGDSAQLDSKGVCGDYRNARMPCKNRTDVKPLKLSIKQIETMLSQAREWDSQLKEAA